MSQNMINMIKDTNSQMEFIEFIANAHPELLTNYLNNGRINTVNDYIVKQFLVMDEEGRRQKINAVKFHRSVFKSTLKDAIEYVNVLVDKIENK